MLSEIKLASLINQLPEFFIPEKAANMEAVIQISILGEQAGEWTIIIRNQHCTVLPGKEEKPTLELSAETQDIMDILTGRLNAMKAFMQGRVHFKGNMSQAMKLTGLFRSEGSILANF